MAALLAAVGATRLGRKYQCPVHAVTGEHSVSLTVGARRDGRGAWLWCHAGCDLTALLRTLRLTGADLRNPPPVDPARHAKAFRLVRQFPAPRSVGSVSERGLRFEAEHFYGHPTPVAKKLRYRHPVTREKAITWESVNPKGEWVPGLLGRRQTDLPLYRVRDLRMAVAAEEVVVLCESESSVDALVKAGIYATCWPGGAGDPPVDEIRLELGTHRRTVFIPDHDDAGLACAERVIASGALAAGTVLLGEKGEDARDMLARLGSTAFRKAVEAHV